MKFLTILFVVCAAISFVKGEEFNKEKFHELAEACKTEAGASDADLDVIVKHGDATTTEAKCMRSCIMKKLGMLDESSHLSKENAMKVVESLAAGDEEKIKAGGEIVNNCSELEVAADHCEAAETYTRCLRQLVGDKVGLDI